MRLAVVAALWAGCALGSAIDTTQVFASGGIDYRYTSEGIAYALDGVAVSGVTFGFNPMPVIDEIPLLATEIHIWAAPIGPMPMAGDHGHNGDHGRDAPEGSTAVLIGLGLMAIRRIR